VPDSDAGKTSPTLLDRVRDWRDHPAWMAFFERYNPLLRRWCGRFGLDSDASDELCQRIWMELMGRMRTFRYDPSRSFRNWLWRLFQSRAIDMLRNRRATSQPSADALALEAMVPSLPDPESSDDPGEARGMLESLTLHRLAAEAQAVVRSRVDPETWRAYWLVAIEDRPFREAAESLGKTYTAVYNGYKRVDRMLRVEGERRLAALLVSGPRSSGSGQR
jgi:RNA polymerase sigma factor (sigma-70 family)